MWFTGALVVVSFLQFAALIWQACLFFRQAGIMNEHRAHLEKLAIAASDNAKAAKDGAEAASKNAEFSKLNALATAKSADAAKISADIAARVAVPTLKISEFKISAINASVSGNLAFFRRPSSRLPSRIGGTHLPSCGRGRSR
jgi:predicted lipid-binding transport protein (Tim44 family)